MKYKDTGKLQLIAQKEFADNGEVVRIVDFLNKTLKKKGLLFGMTRNSETKRVTINIYEI